MAEPINLNMIDRSYVGYVGEMVPQAELVEHFGEQTVDSGYKSIPPLTVTSALCGGNLFKMVWKTMTAVMAGVVPEARDKPFSQFTAYANTYPAKW